MRVMVCLDAFVLWERIMELKPGDKVRALRSFATLKANVVYLVDRLLPDGTAVLSNDVYLYGPSACKDFKERTSWEAVCTPW